MYHCVSIQKDSSKELKKLQATNTQIAQVSPSLKRSSNCLKPKALWELTRILAQVRKLKHAESVYYINVNHAQMAIQRYRLWTCSTTLNNSCQTAVTSSVPVLRANIMLVLSMHWECHHVFRMHIANLPRHPPHPYFQSFQSLAQTNVSNFCQHQEGPRGNGKNKAGGAGTQSVFMWWTHICPIWLLILSMI